MKPNPLTSPGEKRRSPVKAAIRFTFELLLLCLLSSILLIAAIKAALHLTDDEKVQYFFLGYYLAIHNDLVRKIWKKLRIEKTTEEPRSE